MYCFVAQCRVGAEELAQQRQIEAVLRLLS